jgi:hypothetical protein
MEMLNRLALAAACLGALVSFADAADLAPPAEPESEWTFTLIPYVWLAGIDGDVAAFGAPTVEVDLSIGDVLDHFDIGLMGAAEARNGRFSLAADLLWVKLSADENTPFGILANDVELTTNMLMLTGAGAYSLIFEEGGNLDLMVGGRLWSVSNDLEFNGGVLDGRSFDDTQTWVDPFVGLKGRVNLGSDFYLTGWGLIGGGFSEGSKLMWDVMGGLGYAFSDTFSSVVGYRAVSVDYRNDGFVLDVVQDGPILGLVFRF